ncbi:maleylacetoacetate isomerase [Vibrio mediterranei]|uniref:maleylacetoacetate isomerase n=1 Tax=Vibrio mediterranei TaxID=689 RepID=UPI001EFEBB76|nr:maleylacetoacetate isomerase [Vibrio mediterranei]MCG9628116.1 maleylacetoacetate isomerase [Vibrio mediterranei]
MSELILYDYWRSSAAYRVRIALNLKELPYKSIPVHLVKDGGEQHKAEFSTINASELVPVLRVPDSEGNEMLLNQSLTIIDYLDDHYPTPRLTPKSGDVRYLVKALAQDIAIDIHPINNLRVIQHLSQQFSMDDNAKQQWMRHWIKTGFQALEKKLAKTSSSCCVGDDITLVDVCLVPQLYNAERFNIDMKPFPIISTIGEHLRTHSAFMAAEPERQKDAVP